MTEEVREIPAPQPESLDTTLQPEKSPRRRRKKSAESAAGADESSSPQSLDDGHVTEKPRRRTRKKQVAEETAEDPEKYLTLQGAVLETSDDALTITKPRRTKGEMIGQ